jgi:hypothetical protein
MSAVVVDTHAIIWYFLQSQKLSSPALAAINNTDLVYVAVISVVEIIYLQEKGKIPEVALQRLNQALADINTRWLVIPLNPIPVNEFGFYLSNPLGGLILGFFPNGSRWLPPQFLHHYRAIAFGGRFAMQKLRLRQRIGRYFGKWVVWGNNCRLDLRLISPVQSGFLDLG